jgi:hypothetical protein
MTAPLYWTWDGEAMWPLGRFAKLAREAFTVGRVYRLVEDEERSSASHRQYFAAVREAWLNLPETWSDRFPTAEHLRKWCLIKSGFHVQSTWVVASASEALRTAEILRKLDDYAVVLVDRQTVTHFRAKSQSRREMPKAEFQRSKTAVLELLASMLEVSPEQLTTAGWAA